MIAFGPHSSSVIQTHQDQSSPFQRWSQRGWAACLGAPSDGADQSLGLPALLGESSHTQGLPPQDLPIWYNAECLLCLYPPKIHMLKPKPYNMMLFGDRAFWSWLGHEGGPIMNGICALLRGPRASLVAQHEESAHERRRWEFDPPSRRIICHGATNTVHHTCWVCAPEPTSPRACTPHERPPQWDLCTATRKYQFLPPSRGKPVQQCRASTANKYINKIT